MTTAIELDAEDADLFLDQLDRSAGADGCWHWLGGDDGHGRGHFRLRGHRIGAHRVAWVLQRREKLAGHHRLHRTCDTRACVNPAHRQRRRGREPNNDNRGRNSSTPDIIPPRFLPAMLGPTADRGVAAGNAQHGGTNGAGIAQDATHGSRPQRDALSAEIERLSSHSAVLVRALREVAAICTATSKRVAAIERAIAERDGAVGELRGEVERLVEQHDASAHSLSYVSYSVERILFHCGMMPEMPDTEDEFGPEEAEFDLVGDDDGVGGVGAVGDAGGVGAGHDDERDYIAELAEVGRRLRESCELRVDAGE